MSTDDRQTSAEQGPTSQDGAHPEGSSEPDDGPAPGADGADGSELAEGLEHLGRAIGGVMTRLLGSRYTNVALDPDRTVISPQADATLDRASAVLGRWLNATGQGLSAHPADPLAAMDHASRHRHDQVDLRTDEAPLAAGARTLVGGLYRSTEAVLDAVAPRSSKPATAPEESDQAAGDAESLQSGDAD